MELELTANVLRTKDWKFTVSMNTAYNKNKIISLPYNGLPNNMQDAYQVYTGRKLADGTYERQWVGGYQEGQEYGVIYAFKSLGIYKSESEIPGNLIDRSTYTENGSRCQRCFMVPEAIGRKLIGCRKGERTAYTGW